MSWTSVQQYYGFRTPFNFRVAIPFMLSAALLIMVVVASGLLFYFDDLSVGTLRFYFFLYTTALLAIAALVSRFPLASYAVLTWCVIELGLCVLFHREPDNPWADNGLNLFPPNIHVKGSNDPLAIYHPLLVYVPRPGWKLNTGRRVSINSLGLRGREIGPEQLARDLIFVYGGSTTFDFDIDDGGTWVEALQRELHDRYSTINFGMSGYGTTEHLIQTALYQGIVGKKPVCAVYYIGWNDIFNAHAKNLDRGYANFKFLWHAHGVLPKRVPLTGYSPLSRVLNGIGFNALVNLPKIPALDEAPSAGTDEHLEGIYREHVRTITGINSSRGVKTVFIGQILNTAKLKSDKDKLVWWPLVRANDAWPLQQHFNSILRTEAAEDGASYVDAGVDNFQDSDFIDEGHFSAAGAKKFATLIAGQVGAGCQ